MTQSTESPTNAPNSRGKRVVEKLPGMGFIYLCVVVCLFLLYIYWIYQPGWYNGHLSNEERAAKQAAYIEKIVYDYPADQQERLRQEQLKLYQQIGDVASASELLGQLNSDAQRQGELFALLSGGDSSHSDNIENVECLLEEELEAGAVSTWSDLLSMAVIEFVSGRPQSDLTNRILEALLAQSADLPGVTPVSYRRFGIEPDQWVLNRSPGYLLVRVPQSQKMVLTLGVYADPDDFPVTVRVNHSEGVIEEVLAVPDNVQVEVNIPAEQMELIGITTDKFWSVQSDPRKFSVRLVNVELL